MKAKNSKTTTTAAYYKHLDLLVTVDKGQDYNYNTLKIGTCP
jgi:hypothetical protein